MATFTRYLLFAGIIENDTNKTWKLEQWALYQDPLDHNSWTVRLVFFIECRMCWWNSWPGTVIHIGSAVFKCLRHIKSMVTCSIFFFCQSPVVSVALVVLICVWFPRGHCGLLVSCPDPTQLTARRRGLVSQVGLRGVANQIAKQRLLKNAEARTSTSIAPLKVVLWN